MKNTGKKNTQNWFVLFIETIGQYFWITMEFFNKNGLVNHAAAGAYGFLFSAAPSLLFVSFFISRALESTPEIAAALITQMGMLSALDMNELTETFSRGSGSGIAMVVSLVGLLWTARIFAVSLQRGLGVIFPDTGKISTLRQMAVSVGIELAIIVFIFMVVFSSEPAFLLYRRMDIFPLNQNLAGAVIPQFLPLVLLGFLVFGAYMVTPFKSPGRSAALKGALICTLSFMILILVSRSLFDPDKYNVIYGALGNITLLLVDVYFFFIFFFMGAELTFTIHSFDSLLLSHFIQMHSEPQPAKLDLKRYWFTSTKGTIKKYFRFYEKDSVIFHKGEKGDEVYYILSGEAGVYLDEAAMLTLIKQGNFFGEMGLSERGATIKAHADLEVLKIPHDLYQEILKHDTGADQKVIINLSERLKNMNEKLLSKNT